MPAEDIPPPTSTRFSRSCYRARVRNALPKLLVLALAWTLTPCLTEVTENLWHLATEGHSAHAAEESPDHAPQDEEQDCNGTFQRCSCHHIKASDLVPAPLPPAEAPGRGLHAARSAAATEPSPHRLERPPRA